MCIPNKDFLSSDWAECCLALAHKDRSDSLLLDEPSFNVALPDQYFTEEAWLQAQRYIFDSTFNVEKNSGSLRPMCTCRFHSDKALDTAIINDDSGNTLSILADTSFEPCQVKKYFVHFILKLPCGAERVFNGYSDIAIIQQYSLSGIRNSRGAQKATKWQGPTRHILSSRNIRSTCGIFTIC